MSTYDNAPPLPGWESQPGRHCRETCVDQSCPACCECLPIPDSIVLGSE